MPAHDALAKAIMLGFQPLKVRRTSLGFAPFWVCYPAPYRSCHRIEVKILLGCFAAPHQPSNEDDPDEDEESGAAFHCVSIDNHYAWSNRLSF